MADIDELPAGPHRPLFVLDANLGLSVDEAPWAEFLAARGVGVDATSDLVRIDRALADHEPDLAYIPAADYHGIVDDPRYRGLAVATSRRTGLPVQASVLVVRRDDPAESPDDLLGARLGYVNASCSSSYYAPSLLAAERGKTLAEFFELALVPAWQAQIDAVVAGRVRATTVLEDVWAAAPPNADLTKIVGRVEGLAPPVVIARTGLDPALTDAVLARLLAWVPPPGTVYGRFLSYADEYVRPFFAALDRLAGIG